jgi:hypothetical protein
MFATLRLRLAKRGCRPGFQVDWNTLETVMQNAVSVVKKGYWSSQSATRWLLSLVSCPIDSRVRDRLLHATILASLFCARYIQLREGKTIMIPRLKVLIMLSLATLCTPVFGANPARPGTLNYIEGSAYLEGKPLTQRAVGSTDLDPGQVLSTGQGKAEILLTPGVFLCFYASTTIAASR